MFEPASLVWKWGRAGSKSIFYRLPNHKLFQPRRKKWLAAQKNTYENDLLENQFLVFFVIINMFQIFLLFSESNSPLLFLQPIAPAAPVFNAAPVAPAVDGVIASQYHAQDEFGNVNYGYSNPNSQKTEQRDAYGNVMGSYSYNDGTGYPKHVSYVADNFGFRITAANNLPVAPVA